MTRPDYYTAHERGYQTRRGQGHPGWQDEKSLKKTLATLQAELQRDFLPKGGNALELGCGAGDLSLRITHAGFQCTGIDISPTAIDWAREKADEANLKIEFQVANVLKLDQFENESFDLIIDGYCFHCIIGDDRSRFLAEVKRLLKPGGTFLLLSMCGEKQADRLTVDWDPKTGFIRDQDGNPTRYIGRSESILDEVKQTGLEMIEWNVLPQTNEVNDFDELVAWARKSQSQQTPTGLP